jgi:AcrR family transcriptional regulator
MAGNMKRKSNGAPQRVSSRNKRAEILTIATDQFGRQGYEDTKWANVAAEVGVGPTALYHYFETKLHCLYVIMAEAIEEFRADFDRLTRDVGFAEGIEAALRSSFELNDHEVQRLRVLVAEQGLVGSRRNLPREEEARQTARARTQDLEVAWAMHLSRGMAQGAIPEADPQLMARAVLGLYNSIWHWYRPGGLLGLEQVSEFFLPRLIAMIGIREGAAA